MVDKSYLVMINALSKSPGFRIMPLENGSFSEIQPKDYYTVILLQEGEGNLTVDLSTFKVRSNALLFFAPFQLFMLSPISSVTGVVIQFHSDFYCIYRHQKEVACDGILFNNIYDPPFVKIKSADLVSFLDIVAKMKTEMQNPRLAQYELLVTYLKIFLILAARIKTDQYPKKRVGFMFDKEPPILQFVKNAIEENFRVKHSPSDYAQILNIAPKALSRITKKYFNKPLSNLVSERIMIEAKRELFLTVKPVKQIAKELGFTDVYYFSRVFKKNADISPQYFREATAISKGEVR